MNEPYMIVLLFLFTCPILTLISIGVLILIKPVTVINRRWYLAILIPLLAANPVVLISNLLTLTENGWESGSYLVVLLTILADLAITVGFAWALRGVMVHGLTEAEVQTQLKALLTQKGYTVTEKTGKKSFLWATYDQAYILTVQSGEMTGDIWMAESVNEVVIRVDTKQGGKLLKSILPKLRQIEKPYQFKRHAIGIIYLVVALVFAVLTWIYFFEPRLILPG